MATSDVLLARLRERTPDGGGRRLALLRCEVLVGNALAFRKPNHLFDERSLKMLCVYNGKFVKWFFRCVVVVVVAASAAAAA